MERWAGLRAGWGYCGKWGLKEVFVPSVILRSGAGLGSEARLFPDVQDLLHLCDNRSAFIFHVHGECGLNPLLRVQFPVKIFDLLLGQSKGSYHLALSRLPETDARGF